MIEINNTTKQKINFQKIEELTEKFLGAHKKRAWEISLAIVGAAKMRRFNKIYRGLDQTTDVLSFVGSAGRPEPSGQAREGKFLGEIIINIAAPKKVKQYQAMFKEIGLTDNKKIKSASYIFYFLLIHGLLHLVDYEDETTRGRLEMMRLGKLFLEKNL